MRKFSKKPWWDQVTDVAEVGEKAVIGSYLPQTWLLVALWQLRLRQSTNRPAVIAFGWAAPKRFEQQIANATRLITFSSQPAHCLIRPGCNQSAYFMNERPCHSVACIWCTLTHRHTPVSAFCSFSESRAALLIRSSNDTCMLMRSSSGPAAT